MNKKIIAVSLTLLLMVVAFAACKGGGEEPASDTTYSYTKFGDIDVTVDGNGNLFVTNPDGDQIPVTSSKDGFYDDIKDLLTETKAPAVPEDSTADNNQENNNPPSPDPSENPTENPEASTESGVDIGKEGNGGSLSWNEF